MTKNEPVVKIFGDLLKEDLHIYTHTYQQCISLSVHFNVKHMVEEESKAQAYLFWQAAPTLSLLLSTFSCSTLKGGAQIIKMEI